MEIIASSASEASAILNFDFLYAVDKLSGSIEDIDQPLQKTISQIGQQNLEKKAKSKNLPLRAERISPSQFPDAVKIVSDWKQVAQQKEWITTPLHERMQFRACYQLCKCVGARLSSYFSSYEVYACKDAEDNYQAMMVLALQTNNIFISYLVTNPINIRSSVNAKETKKVTGAGTCLLQKAEQIAIAERKEEITLYPVDTAVGFYKKNGFTFETDSVMRKVVTNPHCEPIHEVA